MTFTASHNQSISAQANKRFAVCTTKLMDAKAIVYNFKYIDV